MVQCEDRREVLIEEGKKRLWLPGWFWTRFALGPPGQRNFVRCPARATGRPREQGSCPGRYLPIGISLSWPVSGRKMPDVDTVCRRFFQTETLCFPGPEPCGTTPVIRTVLTLPTRPLRQSRVDSSGPSLFGRHLEVRVNFRPSSWRLPSNGQLPGGTTTTLQFEGALASLPRTDTQIPTSIESIELSGTKPRHPTPSSYPRLVTQAVAMAEELLDKLRDAVDGQIVRYGPEVNPLWPC